MGPRGWVGRVALACTLWRAASLQTRRRRVVPLQRGTRPGLQPPGPGAAPSLVPILGALDTFYKAKPYEAAFLTCAVKAFAADAVAQFRIEKVQSLKWKRAAAFVAYGGLYQGVAQYFIFNRVYPALFGHGTDLATVAAEVAFDQLVTTPLLCLPVAYLVKAVVYQYPLHVGLKRYVADARRDLLWKYWGIWTPVTALVFSLVPEYLRIPVIASVSFFWLILLSNITGRAKTEKVGQNLCTSVASTSSADACQIADVSDTYHRSSLALGGSRQ